MFKLTPCFVRNTSNLLTKIRSISSIWIKLARITLVFRLQEKQGQVECSQVLILNNFWKQGNNIFPGLFDSLLNAMNEDSSDDENGPPAGPSSAPAASRAAAPTSGGNKKLEQEDLD